MSDPKSLDHLGLIADEMLGGLHAGEAMRLRIRREAMEGAAPKRKNHKSLVPAVCMAALAVVCLGAVGMRALTPGDTAVAIIDRGEKETPQPVEIKAIAAGGGAEQTGEGVMIADLGDGAKVRMASARDESLFAAGGADMPLVAVGGRVYRMLARPEGVGEGMLDGAVGSVQMHTGEPSLASAADMEAGLSSVAAEGTAIYAIRGLPDTTAVAAEVDGQLRVFQRVSYAGRGPAGAALEETFAVRGRVREMTLSGVGTLEGDRANAVMAVLLDEAVLKSADAAARSEYLTVTLESGLQLQLGVSGDTVTGCGGWSCPEFFEAFEAAL